MTSQPPFATAPQGTIVGPGLESPVGLHRVVRPRGVLPQAAEVLDPDPTHWPGETRISLSRLNLDAASARQLRDEHDSDGDAVRAHVLALVARRGKLHNPVTGSGGMLVGVVDEVGPQSLLGLEPGQRVATLVSLTLTPLWLTDGLARWDGLGEQAPAAGHAVLFARSSAAVLPDPADIPETEALAVLDVCGAPALVTRVLTERQARGRPVTVAVLGGAGKSGSLCLAAAQRCGAERVIALVPTEDEAHTLAQTELADAVVVADARDPMRSSAAVRAALGGAGADVTVVCVDVPGCEHGAVLATASGGVVVFFAMATSFSAAALGAEGLAADVTMLVGNGYVPGHAALALDLYRASPGVRALVQARTTGHH